MPFDPAGNFTRVRDWTNDAAAAIKIRADFHDANDDDIAAGLSLAICKDGRSQISADIPWNGRKITNLGAPSAATDAATKGYVDALRTFSTPITMSGAGANGRIKFTGVTMPVGLEFSTPDISFGAKGSPDLGQWVWNNKADMTGDDLMSLTEGNGGTSAQLQITSKLASGINPYLILNRSNIIAAGGAMGGITMQGRNSADVAKNFGLIYTRADDLTSGTEDSALIFQIYTDGAVSAALQLTGLNNVLVGSLQLTEDIRITKVGATGIRFTNLDIGWGINAGGSFLWNAKGDLSGDNAMVLSGTNSSPINASLQLVSKVATTAVGPYVLLLRDFNQVAGGNVGGIAFQSKNAAGTLRNYGHIITRVDDPVNTSEDSTFLFQVYTAGAVQNALVLNGINNILAGNTTIAGTLVTAGTGGSTIASTLNIDSGGNALLALNKNASTNTAYIQGKTNGSLRWQMQLGDATAEAAGNVGSNFALHAYDNAGVNLGFAISIARATRVVNFAADPTVGADTVLTTGNSFYTGAAAANTAFPVGSHVFAFHTASLQRNAAAAIGISSVAGMYEVNAPSPLAGTWRSRGSSNAITGATFHLMQRVA